MPYDYPSYATNSSWLFDHSQTLAHFKKTYQKAEPILHCNAVQPQRNFRIPQDEINIHKTYMHSRTTQISISAEP